MRYIRRGLIAGFLAGLLLAMLNFVTDGTPGRTLPDALHWFGITIADPTISRFAGFFLLIVLGGIAGIIFGLVQREEMITISRALLSGLVLGFVWWLIFSLVLTNIMNHASSPRALVLVALFVACFAFLPAAEAACQDGCNSSLFNTFQGDDALISNTAGAGNTALGWRSLFLDSTGSFNTGVGGGALVLNNGDSNTAVGAAALLLNTIGTDNVAVGTDALVFNDDGSDNVAVGAFALAANVSGIENVAVGFNAGASTTGGFSVAVGFNALGGATGGQNTAVGDNALFSVTTGVLNTALGDLAGNDIVAGNNINVIGAFQSGISTTNGEVDNSTYISNIIGAGVDAGTSQFVFVDQDGKLGTTALPGTGNLPSGRPQAILNHKVEKLEATVAQQQKQIEKQRKQMEIFTAQLKEQAAQIQRVSAQLQLKNSAPRTVVSDQ